MSSVVERLAQIDAFIVKGEGRVKRMRETLEKAIAEIEGAREIRKAVSAQPDLPLQGDKAAKAGK